MLCLESHSHYLRQKIAQKLTQESDILKEKEKEREIMHTFMPNRIIEFRLVRGHVCMAQIPGIHIEGSYFH